MKYRVHKLWIKYVKKVKCRKRRLAVDSFMAFLDYSRKSLDTIDYTNKFCPSFAHTSPVAFNKLNLESRKSS